MWTSCKRLLCIRADNMGDVLMTSPALRALKESFGAHLTLLTSSMGAPVAPYIPVIDAVIVADLPWVKAGATQDGAGMQSLIHQLAQGGYDGAIIFTVYSQSALPAALLTLLAGIPRRLAYCRENPYELLTDWVPDEEPYTRIGHQVTRDLQLVQHIGAKVQDSRLMLEYPIAEATAMRHQLQAAGLSLPGAYVVFHPGVSESKRQYPVERWQDLIALVSAMDIPIVVTGTASERGLADAICAAATADKVVNAAGLLRLGAFIALIDAATLVVSVNTATVHIAAARQKPVFVLYALTNPQHTPWMTPSRVFPFSIQDAMRSSNQVVRHVHNTLFTQPVPLPPAACIAREIAVVWRAGSDDFIKSVP